jgi:uncharacterized protein (TIGR02421 family)
MDLIRADRLLDRISHSIAFSSINPVNLEEEKDRFFSQPGYNPQFMYHPVRVDSEQIRRLLASIECDSSPVGTILNQTRDRYIQEIRLIESRGRSEFTDISMDLHGEPDAELVKQATMLVSKKSRAEHPSFNTSQIVRKLELAFVKYGFHWKVEPVEMIANAAVKLRTKTLLVRKDSRFSRKFLKRIVVHEIGTHITRADNGEYQPYTFFSRGLPGYLMTEEGLAVFNEEQNGCLDHNVLRTYAGRVLAIGHAMKYPFRETYEMLRKDFTKNDAWRLTVRAKRGLSDTSQPGAFTKDIAYLKGYMRVKAYAESGGDMTMLYYGKLGLEHIEAVKSIPGLVHPDILPMFRYVDYFRGHFSNIMDRVVYRDSIPNFDLRELTKS